MSQKSWLPHLWNQSEKQTRDKRRQTKHSLVLSCNVFLYTCQTFGCLVEPKHTIGLGWYHRCIAIFPLSICTYTMVFIPASKWIRIFFFIFLARDCIEDSEAMRLKHGCRQIQLELVFPTGSLSAVCKKLFTMVRQRHMQKHIDKIIHSP